MNLHDILLKLQFVANKSHSGNRLTPEYYNVLLADASNQKFKDEWQTLTILAKKAGTPVTEAMIEDTPLNRYKKDQVLEETSAAGVVNLPTDFQHSFGMYAIYRGAVRAIPIVSEEEINAHLSSMAMPSLEFSPKATKYGSTIKVYPFDLGKNPNKIRLTYMRKPATPYFDYCVRNTVPAPIYMPVGSYILNNASGVNLFNSANQLIARDVQHPYFSITDPIPYDPNPARDLTRYNSRTVELDWEETEYPSLVSILMQPFGVNLQNEQVQNLGKEGQQ